MQICTKCYAAKNESEFYKLRPKCKQCSKEETQIWRLKNKERNAQNAMNWAKANPDKVRESNRKVSKKNSAAIVERVRKWTLNNPDKRRATASAWARDNPAKVLAGVVKYRAAKLNATPTWANPICMMLEFYKLAEYYRSKFGGDWDVDHIVPLRGETVCGLHVEFNLQVITSGDNMSKGNRTWPDMWDDC